VLSDGSLAGNVRPGSGFRIVGSRRWHAQLVARLDRRMNFRLETLEVDSEEYVVALGGEVDLYTAPQLRQELARIIEAGAKKIVVDLSETTFIDSTMLSVLLAAGKQLQPSGGQLAIVVDDRSIRKIFEITLLDRVFSMFETRSAALEQLTSSA
jgi:anti-sigma B factor antagonist